MSEKVVRCYCGVIGTIHAECAEARALIEIDARARAAEKKLSPRRNRNRTFLRRHLLTPRDSQD